MKKTKMESLSIKSIIWTIIWIMTTAFRCNCKIVMDFRQTKTLAPVEVTTPSTLDHNHFIPGKETNPISDLYGLAEVVRCKHSSIKEMECPTGLTKDLGGEMFGNPYEILVLTGKPRTTRRGFLCTKLIHETECYENFLAVETVTFDVRHKVISKKECEIAIEKYKMGQYTPPQFPGRKCEWMRINKQIREDIAVLETNFDFDPIQGKLGDNVIQGECDSENWCKTNLPSQMVKIMEDLKEDLKLITTKEAALFDLTTKFIQSDLIGSFQVDGENDKVLFEGVPWWRSPNGLLFKPLTTDFGRGEEKIIPEAHPKLLTSDAYKRLIFLKNKRYSQIINCRSVLPLYQDRNHLNLPMLMNLKPVFEGPGILYAVERDSGNVTECNVLFTMDKTKQPPLSKLPLLKEFDIINHWTNIGLIKGDHLYEYGEDQFMEGHNISSDVITSFHTHPVVIHYKDHNLTLSDGDLVSTSTKKVSFFFEHQVPYEKIALILIGLVLLYFLYKILYLCISRRRIYTQAVSI